MTLALVERTPTLGRRMLCMVYESLLVFGISFFADWLFEVLARKFPLPHVDWARQVWLIGIIGAYFVYFWSRTGQTLAMKTWRIKLVTIEGKLASPRHAFLRYCLAWMWFLPAILLGYSSGLRGKYMLFSLIVGIPMWASTIWCSASRQFLHDLAAKTRLVQLEK